MKITLLNLSLALSAATGMASPVKAPTTRELFHFPNATFIENIAVRPNGHLLLNTFDNGRMYTIDPSAPHITPQVAAQLPDVASLTGITEIAPDVFAVSGGNPVGSYSFQEGSLKVFVVDFVKGKKSHGKQTPVVKKIADVPNTEILNGMTHLPKHPHIILTADSVQGRIFRVDTKTGAVDIAFGDQKLAAGKDSSPPLGVNGIKIYDDYMYFTNSAQQFFGRIKITAKGDRAGDIEEIVTVADRSMAYDDFAMARDGTAYVGTHPSYLSKITPDGKQTILVGADNREILFAPTSAALSRDERKAYVITEGASTMGGVNGGQVVEVTLC
ncbi:hypothetical protein QWA68_016520 [Fusarium oxysporum]|nr:hypothetical protein QWA68_016520 [Fusarium oxysporum]